MGDNGNNLADLFGRKVKEEELNAERQDIEGRIVAADREYSFRVEALRREKQRREARKRECEVRIKGYDEEMKKAKEVHDEAVRRAKEHLEQLQVENGLDDRKRDDVERAYKKERAMMQQQLEHLESDLKRLGGWLPAQARRESPEPAEELPELEPSLSSPRGSPRQMIPIIASFATELGPASRSHTSPELNRRPQSQSNEPLPPFQDPNAGHKRGHPDVAEDQSPKRKRSSYVADDDDNPGQRIESDIVLERSYDFDDVYCDGSPRHCIQEHPPGGGKWYIFECLKHQKYFKSRHPVQGAARHLKFAKGGHNKANSKPQSNELAMKELAVRVRNCDADKATKNNEVFAAEWAAENKAIERRSTTAGWGVIDAKPGHMYRAFWQDDMSPKITGTYVAMVLPTGDLSSVTLAGSLSDTILAKNIPHCYRTQGKRILGWAKGYEDGGPRARRRKFAVLYFDKEQKPIPPCGPFEPEYVDDLCWQSAQDLRWFDWEDDQCRETNGYQHAKAFKDRIAHRLSCTCQPLAISGPSLIVTIPYPIPSFATSIPSTNRSIGPARRSTRRQVLDSSDESESDDESFSNIRPAVQLGDHLNPILLSSDASELEDLEADDYLPTELDEIEQLQAIERVPKKEIVDEPGGVTSGTTEASSTLPVELTAAESLLGPGTGVSLRSGTTPEVGLGFVTVSGVESMSSGGMSDGHYFRSFTGSSISSCSGLL